MANEHDAVLPPTSDDLTVIITPHDVVRAEGSDPWTPFTFTMTLVGDTSVARDIWWMVEPGTGDHPAEYNEFDSSMGPVHFAAGETSKDFVVLVRGDRTVEADETFTVVALHPESNLPFGTAAQGTVLNDDTAIGIAARALWVREGSEGVQHAMFDVTRRGDLSLTQSVDWHVTGSLPPQADASDFVSGVLPHGSITFLPGETTKTIEVALAPDFAVEPGEWFEVALSDALGLSAGAYAMLAIADDDATVEVRRLEIDMAEGDAGTTIAAFELLLTGDSSQSRSISWKVTPRGRPSRRASATRPTPPTSWAACSRPVL